MKTLILLITLLLTSCSNKETLEFIGQDVIYGKVSAIEPGHTGRIATLPIIYVQTDKQTVATTVPFSFEGMWKIGDSCLVIINKYKINEKDKNTNSDRQDITRCQGFKSRGR